ncbi:MAG TPA: hypothetical protein VGC09_02750, partial [Rhodopila sp.]
MPDQIARFTDRGAYLQPTVCIVCRRPDRAHDAGAQRGDTVGDHRRTGSNLFRPLPAYLRILRDFGDPRGDRLRGNAALSDIARDFLRCRRLLLNRGGNARENFRYCSNRPAKAGDDGNRAIGRGLDRLNLTGDFRSGMGGLAGQTLDLGGHDVKAAPGFPGARRFDRGVQRQQIRLCRDAADQLHDVAYPQRTIRKRSDLLLPVLAVADGPLCGTARSANLGGDLLDRGGQLLACRADRLGVRQRLVCGLGHALGVAADPLRHFSNTFGLASHFTRIGGDALNRCPRLLLDM